MRLALAIFLSLMFTVSCPAQSSTEGPAKNAINNLVLPKDYQPNAHSSIPEFKVYGEGKHFSSRWS
jgi:hypothetical protein